MISAQSCLRLLAAFLIRIEPPEAMSARRQVRVREIHPCEFPTCSCAEIVADHILFVPGEECGRCFECCNAVRSKEWDPTDLRWNVLAVKIVARQRIATCQRDALKQLQREWARNATRQRNDHRQRNDRRQRDAARQRNDHPSMASRSVIAVAIAVCIIGVSIAAHRWRQ